MYDPQSDRGFVRLLISDTSEAPIFADTEIDVVLTREGGVVKRAAATLIEIVADNEALIAKAIRTQDLQTDGPAVAKSLRERAASLRAQADAEKAAAAVSPADEGIEIVAYEEETSPELSRAWLTW